MPAGERSRRQSQGFNYGASVAGENVDFAPESTTESPGTRDRALLDKLKDALKPGDARKLATGEGAKYHSSGMEEGMHHHQQSGQQREYYDEREEVSPRRRGSMLDELGTGESSRPREGVRRRSVFDELGERMVGNEGTQRRGSVLDELGDKAKTQMNANAPRRGNSIFENMPFGLGQSQSQQQSQQKKQGGGEAVAGNKNKKSGAGGGSYEHYRDTTDMSKTDEHHLPGTMYHTIRDDFLK
ncbi:hypothetical protein F4777DRAFT_579839 [Nemania sp. FL0916]|nr:hypothetical protein F4777DRAFT_579839 [Nemania sp. FL0916]